MNETETTEWQEMLRHLHDDQVNDNTTIDDDGVKHVDIEVKMVNDDRRAKWQRLLLDAVDEDAVLHAVWEFFCKRLEEKIRRHEEGEPWKDDRKGVLLFGPTSDELRTAADRAIVFGMGEVVTKLMKRIDKKHDLMAKGWYDQIDRNQMHQVIYELLLNSYVVPDPNL